MQLDERSFQAGGFDFKLLKMDAMSQFHMVRKLGPLLSEVLPALGKVKATKTDGLTEEQKFEEFSKILSPIFMGLSRLTDKDADTVLYGLLSCVEVHQKDLNSWTRVAVKDLGIKMQDIELPVLLQAAGRALMYNLAGFLASRPR